MHWLMSTSRKLEPSNSRWNCTRDLPLSGRGLASAHGQGSVCLLCLNCCTGLLHEPALAVRHACLLRNKGLPLSG